MPKGVQLRFDLLMQDLEQKGPQQPNWPNYSKLGPNQYHCHLTYKWVACWRCEKKSIKIEVYYAGPRENAPY